ncbi:chitinase 1-like [Gossypium australe]|uniref:Chitinase 1-like n=1 Tax=Gossypium australe TaxID=47621 RepID=A0A5B6X066_9ROSI|nr:chitinase 1-like [Gossypium australe]
MPCCNVNHFQAAKRVLRYIKGTLSFGMMFTKVDSMNLICFADSDWIGSIDDMKSTSGSCSPSNLVKEDHARYELASKRSNRYQVCDQSAVAIAKNLVFHGKTKHFKIKFHFVREMDQSQEIRLVHCSSEDQLADILTKLLCVSRFKNLRA